MEYKRKKIVISLLVLFISAAALLVLYNKIYAHCDTLDGPVVKACRNSLEKGNVNLVLIWVQKKDEAEIREVFEKTLALRKLSPEAGELAELHFFETVVRVHRAGEGAAYTGLKPAGGELDPAIPAGDKAIETGSAKEVQQLLTDAVRDALDDHFREVMEKKNYDPDNVEAGREYVKAYVEYIHFVEGIYRSAKNPVTGHYDEPEAEELH